MAEIIELSDERRDVYRARQFLRREAKRPPATEAEIKLLEAIFEGIPEEEKQRNERILELARDQKYR